MTFTTMPSSLLMPVGQDVDLFPMPSELTVAQAARMLGVSEAGIDEYIDDGIIESRWENGKRLIQWDSLVKFYQKRKWMEEGLNEIVRMSQEMGLYDD